MEDDDPELIRQVDLDLGDVPELSSLQDTGQEGESQPVHLFYYLILPPLSIGLSSTHRRFIPHRSTSQASKISA